MSNILSMIAKKECEITGKSAEYLDKYLFPFEKPDCFLQELKLFISARQRKTIINLIKLFT